MAVPLPSDLVVDVRDPIAGDSYTWEGTEPLAAKKSLVIHHSGVNTVSSGAHEDAYSVADFCVNSRGWGGVEYHFVITHDNYPGSHGLAPGAQIQYCGDLGSWRAHVINQNPTRIGVCLIGDFTTELPGENQLKKARQLIDFLLAPNNILPSFNYYSQVTYHNAVPDQSTACPGWGSGAFSEWFSYLQGGTEPSWWTPAPPPPAPIAPIAATDVHTTAAPVVPDYSASWNPYVTPETKTITEPDAFAVDATGAGAPIAIPVGHTVDIAGEFTSNNKLYYRTVYSADHSTWYGVSFDKFTTPGMTPNATIPVTVATGTAPNVTIAPTPSVDTVTPPVPTSAPIIVSAPSGVLTLTKILAWLFSPLLKLIGSLRKG